jgi:hypothetical protein
MSFNINTFKSIVSTTDFARPSLFQVFISTPSGVAPLLPFSPFLVRAASLPASNIGQINIPYGGRTIKIAGERTYGDWSTTIMNDEGFIIRNAMETWVEIMNQRETNFRAFPNEYKVDLKVVQYSKKGAGVGVPLKSITLVGCFPTNISEIALDWGASDQIEEYTVSWAYDYWDSNPVAGLI